MKGSKGTGDRRLIQTIYPPCISFNISSSTSFRGHLSGERYRGPDRLVEEGPKIVVDLSDRRSKTIVVEEGNGDIMVFTFVEGQPRLENYRSDRGRTEELR